MSMKPKARVKIVVDICMAILLLMQMGYHMMDNRAHEWTGIGLCVLFVVHHVLNGEWYASLVKGQYTPRRVLLTVVDVLLTLAMAAVICSAVLVSRHVFGFLGLQMRFVGRTLHMPATMWAFVLTGLHLGLHWSMLLGMMRRAGKGRGTKAVLLAARLALAAVFAFGVYQFVARGLWMELFVLREFAFLDYGEQLLFFFASYVAILAAWAAIAHYFNKALRGIQNRAHQSTQKEADA